MDRKIVMGVAAVAGIGLLLYLRKSGDSSAIGSAGTLVGAAAAANNWATQPIVINTKAPPVVADTTAKSPAPAPAPSAPNDGFVIGGLSAGAAPFVGTPQPTVRDPNDPGRMTVSEYEASQRWLSSF